MGSERVRNDREGVIVKYMADNETGESIGRLLWGSESMRIVNRCGAEL